MIEGSFTFLAPQSALDEILHMMVWTLLPIWLFSIRTKTQKSAEINDNKWATKATMCCRADTQICQWYKQLLFNCLIPHLYGLSILGTSLHIYCGNKASGEVTPDFVEHPSAGRG
jgi:hypothetical protein